MMIINSKYKNFKFVALIGSNDTYVSSMKINFIKTNLV